MTARAAARQRQRRAKRALAGGRATRQLHHLPGHYCCCFPRQIRLSHKVAVWREADIDAWIASAVAEAA